MKNFISVLLAFALILGLNQCKKNVETVQSVPDGVYITLDVEGGDKVIVDPHGGSNYATVNFEAGDVIYVGNNGAYCGFLTYNGTSGRFEGTIEPTSDDNTDYLHFYFMGNKGPTDQQPTYVYIGDQTDKYPVISYGRSTYLYSSTNTNYSATLQNYCSIMKFPIAGAGTDKPVVITGMANDVYIDFYANHDTITGAPYHSSMSGNGEIILHSENANEKWAIVLPQPAVDAPLRTQDYVYTATVSVPAISTNEYHNNDISAINLTETKSSFTEALFSVADGRQVRFSPGNLQATYDGSSWSWNFAQRQWGYIGNIPGNTILTDQEPWISRPGTVDLFGFSSNKTYFGISSSGYDRNYIGDFVDWGTNAIGSDTANTWRTLTRPEWLYLTNDVYYDNATRVDKLASATVNGVHGIVLLPDSWTLPAGCTFNPSGPTNNGWESNIYDADAWALMEANGAVFLPAAGERTGTFISNVNILGDYWSTANIANSTYANGFFIFSNSTSTSNVSRYYGCSVRLVRNN